MANSETRRDRTAERVTDQDRVAHVELVEGGVDRVRVSADPWPRRRIGGAEPGQVERERGPVDALGERTPSLARVAEAVQQHKRSTVSLPGPNSHTSRVG